jgi:HSP20 family protein
MNVLSRIDALDKLLPDMLRNFGRPLRAAEDFPAEIRLDVSEGEKDYQVRAEVPGARKDDIRVTVDGNYVSISCEVRHERQEKAHGRVLVQETSFGSASRGFSLAHEIDSSGVVAKLEDGVLKLTLPKRAGAQSRLIAVQ